MHYSMTKKNSSFKMLEIKKPKKKVKQIFI